MFGDFELQMIYGEQASTIHTTLAQRLGRVTRYSLRTNCRNTPRIAEMVRLLGQMDPGYTKILRPDNQAEPKINIFSTENQKRKLLLKSLRELLAEGFSPGDIVILSPHTRDADVPRLLGIEWNDRLQPLKQSQWKENTTVRQIRYGTIHSFKGMEAPVVIVIGADNITSEQGISLLYIALSRALHRLIVLLNKDVQRDLLAALTARNLEGIND